ncbi:MAG: AsmA family protein [Burkholderiaceae bacterium]
MRASLALLVLLAALVAAFAAAEAVGWRFLAEPAQALASRALQRPVRLHGEGAARFQLHLLGGPRLALGRLTVADGPPEGTSEGLPDGTPDGAVLLAADDVQIGTAWADIGAAARGRQPWRLSQLRVRSVVLQLARSADGRANWQFGGGDAAATPLTTPARRVQVDALTVGDGVFSLRDAALGVVAHGHFSAGASAWDLQAAGRYRGEPMGLQARAGSAIADAALGTPEREVPLAISLQAGRAALRYAGLLRGLGADASWDGEFKLSGPSLAAAGEPVGLTLPTTPPFVVQGHLARRGSRVAADIADARIGRSELSGHFVFEPQARPRPLLRGTLNGRALWLADLGPAIGTEPQPAASPAAAKGRVLPDRPFDLPSLSRMDADLRIALDRLVLGHPNLESVQPLRGHLTLQDSVLTLADLEARLAEGRLSGSVRLDGRASPATWGVDLRARGLRLEEWVRQERRAGAPPYLSGRLAGRVELTGRGRSAAELLATSDGRSWLLLEQGRLSHLATEAAGLDIAQALGVALRGDDALPVGCGAADLQVRAGLVRPQVLLLDTRDSTIWVDGQLSFADESLALTAHVEPKDFSPLALRSPLRLRGTLGDPRVSIEKGPLLRRVVPAALLAMLNPLAGLLPLLDAGDDDGRAALQACQRVLQQHAGDR